MARDWTNWWKSFRRRRRVDRKSIFAALAETSGWPEAERLLRQDPTLVYERNREGRLPLHELLRTARVLSIFESQEEEDTTSLLDDDDFMFGTNAQFEGLFRLLEAFHVRTQRDDTRNEEDNRGSHRIVQHNDDKRRSSIGVDSEIYRLCKLMIDLSYSLGPTNVSLDTDEGGTTTCTYSSVLLVPDGNGKLPLHCLIEGYVDYEILNLFLSAKRPDGSDMVVDQLSSRDVHGSTPLHYLAASFSCPFPSFRLAMDFAEAGKARGLLKVMDRDGETPLHWAMAAHISKARLEQLVRCNSEHDVEVWNMRNSDGLTPLGVFLDNVDTEAQCRVQEEVMEYIQVILCLSAESKASRFASKRDLVRAIAATPILFEEEILDHVFRDITLKDTDFRDAKGQTALHLACTSGQRLVASQLLDLDPGMLEVWSATEGLALHCALRANRPWSWIQALVEAYPKSVSVPDPGSGLMPFAMSQDPLVIFELLRRDPSILQAPFCAAAAGVSDGPNLV